MEDVEEEKNDKEEKKGRERKRMMDIGRKGTQ